MTRGWYEGRFNMKEIAKHVVDMQGIHRGTYFTLRLNKHLYGVWLDRWDPKPKWTWQLLISTSKRFPHVSSERIRGAVNLLNRTPDFAGLTAKQFLTKILLG